MNALPDCTCVPLVWDRGINPGADPDPDCPWHALGSSDAADAPGAGCDETETLNELEEKNS